MSETVDIHLRGKAPETLFMVESKTGSNELPYDFLRSAVGQKSLLVVLLVCGLFFRLTNLDMKVYQHDEVMTSLRVAGFQVGEVKQQLFANQEIGIQDLQQYQRVSSVRGMFDTWTSLATDDPKHPPLYYSFAWIWTQVFGDSVTAIRSLSVLISLLALICFYWLCYELFASSSVAWMAVALISISPFHVLYAQEARQYSLWILVTVLSCAALLRALRLHSWGNWSTYAVAVAMGLYTHILFIFVVFAHGVYIVGTSWHKITIKQPGIPKEVAAYLLATLTAFLAFAPWAFIIAFQLPTLYDTTRWITKKVESLYVLKHWVLGFSSLFLDPSGGIIFSARAGIEKPTSYMIRLPILLLIGYSLFFLWRTTPKQVWFFILALTGGAIVPLMLLDVVTEWRTSTPFRYLTPGYMGIQLAVAYLLSSETTSSRSVRRKGWQIVTVVLVVGAIASCIRNRQAEVWWNKEASYILPQVAHHINQASSPLLVSTLDGKNLGNSIALSYLLETKVRFRALHTAEIPQDLDRFTDVFILDPSMHLQQQLEKKGYTLEAVIASEELWRLKGNQSLSLN